MDPGALSRCLPGCERFERTEPPTEAGPVAPDTAETYVVALRIGVGAAKGLYQGQMRVSGKVPERCCVLTVQGGGALGSVRGQALVELRKEDAGVAGSAPHRGGPGTWDPEAGIRGSSLPADHRAPAPPDDAQTVLTYRGEAHVGGVVAIAGERALTSVFHILATEFFRRLEQQLP